MTVGRRDEDGVGGEEGEGAYDYLGGLMGIE
jgi:hypothetical protein